MAGMNIEIGISDIILVLCFFTKWYSAFVQLVFAGGYVSIFPFCFGWELVLSLTPLT